MSTTERRQLERRIFRGEFRDVPGSDGRQKWATAVAYDVVDSYGTIWRPGVFDEALARRMPVILYGHNWTDLDHVLGRGIDFRQTPSDVGPPGVDVLMEFVADDPIAARAMKLLSSTATSRGAVLRDVSVGFERLEWERRADLTTEELAAGAEEAMIKAGMDELSLVVAGAVPGAQVRGRRGVVDLDAVVEIAKRKAAGTLSAAEAEAALELLGTSTTDGGEPPKNDAGSGDDAGAEDAAAADAAAQAAIDAAFGRGKR